MPRMSPCPRQVARMPEHVQRRLTATMLELRNAGLTYPAIAVVMSLYEGVDLTEEQVRRWAVNFGVPRNPNKITGAARATMERHGKGAAA